MIKQRYLTLEQASVYSGKSRTWLYRYGQAVYNSIKIGGTWSFDRYEIDKAHERAGCECLYGKTAKKIKIKNRSKAVGLGLSQSQPKHWRKRKACKPGRIQNKGKSPTGRKGIPNEPDIKTRISRTRNGQRGKSRTDDPYNLLADI